MRAWLPVSALVATLFVVTSCALFRPAPDLRPALDPPPTVWVDTVPLIEVSAQESAAPSQLGLAGAWTMFLVGWAWPAEPLLAEVAVMARAEGDRVLEARALTLRGVLAWERDQPGEAIALLGAASTVDPLGFVGRSAQRTAEMMGRLGDRAAEIAVMRARLSAARAGLQMSEDEARTLESEVNTLRRQLDELKQLHIQIESEKQDDPS